MKAWKPISLCCLLALSLASYAVPAPLPSGGVESAPAVATVTPATAAFLAELGGTFTLSSQFNAKVCSINSCFRNGDPCVCPDGITHGTCLDHDCKP